MKFIIFDMDNTLSLSRQVATEEMVTELNRIKKKYKIFIASGAELIRMMMQVPITEVTWFAQNGNHLWEFNQELWRKEFNNKNEILEHINRMTNYYSKMYPNYEIEDRGCSLVVSFTGFHAPFGIKNAFDPDRSIRLGMLKMFPHPNAYVAGTSGIDFIPFTKGKNIKDYITQKKLQASDFLYIGDALEPGANDYTVCGIIPTFAVKNPDETLKFLKQL